MYDTQRYLYKHGTRPLLRESIEKSTKRNEIADYDDIFLYPTFKDNIVCEGCDTNIPAYSVEVDSDSFWRFLYSNKWKDCCMIRVKPGHLHSDLISSLIDLLASKEITSHKTVNFLKIKPNNIFQQREQKHGTIHLEFTYYGKDYFFIPKCASTSAMPDIKLKKRKKSFVTSRTREQSKDFRSKEQSIMMGTLSEHDKINSVKLINANLELFQCTEPVCPTDILNTDDILEESLAQHILSTYNLPMSNQKASRYEMLSQKNESSFWLSMKNRLNSRTDSLLNHSLLPVNKPFISKNKRFVPGAKSAFLLSEINRSMSGCDSPMPSIKSAPLSPRKHSLAPNSKSILWMKKGLVPKSDLLMLNNKFASSRASKSMLKSWHSKDTDSDVHEGEEDDDEEDIEETYLQPINPNNISFEVVGNLLEQEDKQRSVGYQVRLSKLFFSDKLIHKTRNMLKMPNVTSRLKDAPTKFGNQIKSKLEPTRWDFRLNYNKSWSKFSAKVLAITDSQELLRVLLNLKTHPKTKQPKKRHQVQSTKDHELQAVTKKELNTLFNDGLEYIPNSRREVYKSKASETTNVYQSNFLSTEMDVTKFKMNKEKVLESLKHFVVRQELLSLSNTLTSVRSLVFIRPSLFTKVYF